MGQSSHYSCRLRAKAVNPEEKDEVRFEFLEKDCELEINQRNLPHWFQPGAAMFVTFRTYDSMPKKVVQQWNSEVRRWLKNAGIEYDLSFDTGGELPSKNKQAQIKNLPEEIKNQIKKTRIRLWQQKLDQCHGLCLLKQKEISKIVSDALLYFDGQRYDLDSFVIMPNHVHAIVQFKNGYDQSLIGQSWMRYTARQINALCGLNKEFWQSEAFDHIIRNEAQFSYLQKYIQDNPKRARLNHNDFVCWTRQE